MVDVKTRLRDEVCRGPRYPGRPQDYTYVLSESCRPVLPHPRSKNSKKPKSDDQKTERKRRPLLLDAVDVDVLKREVDRIREYLRSNYPKNYVDVHLRPNAMNRITDFFSLMTNAEWRSKFPDPLRRYDAIVDLTLSNLKDDERSAEQFKRSQPKFTILRLTAEHLIAVFSEIRYAETKTASTPSA